MSWKVTLDSELTKKRKKKKNVHSHHIIGFYIASHTLLADVYYICSVNRCTETHLLWLAITDFFFLKHFWLSVNIVESTNISSTWAVFFSRQVKSIVYILLLRIAKTSVLMLMCPINEILWREEKQKQQQLTVVKV